MTRSETVQNPLLPAGYDIVWSVATAGIVILLVLALVTVVRLVRSPGGARQGAVAPDAVERVRQLAQLRDEGAITTEEYEARKNRLLGPVR